MSLFLLLSLMGFLSESDLLHVDLCVCVTLIRAFQAQQVRVGRKVWPSSDRTHGWEPGSSIISISKLNATMCKFRPESQCTASCRGREGQGEKITHF